MPRPCFLESIVEHGNEMAKIIGTGPRLRVRCWSLSSSDIQSSFKLWGNPEIIQFMLCEGVSTLEETRDKLTVQQGCMRDHGTQQWAVELKESRQVIGACGLSRMGESSSLDLSFCYIPESFGHGYATEAGILVCRYGFSELNQAVIAAGTLGDNKASQNVLHKIGFIQKGTKVWPDNQQEDPYFELVAADLAAVP